MKWREPAERGCAEQERAERSGRRLLNRSDGTSLREDDGWLSSMRSEAVAVEEDGLLKAETETARAAVKR